MRAYVAELPGVSFAAGLSFAVGYVPRHLIYLHIPAGHHRLALVFVQRIKHVGRGMYPVVYGRGRQLQTKLGEHLDLTILGQMVVELVVDKRGQQIGTDMSAADDAAGTFGLKDFRRWSVFVTFASQYRGYGLYYPHALRLQMQNVGLVLPDDIIVVKVDAVGINGLCLYRQTVCVVFLRTLASALRLGLSLSTAFIRSLVNISGCLLKFLFRCKYRLPINIIEERGAFIFYSPVFERTAESSTLQLLDEPGLTDDNLMAGLDCIG